MQTGPVFDVIHKRLKTRYGIDIKKYVYFEVDDKGGRKSTLKEGKTTLDGIEFVCQNDPIGRRAPDVGIFDLKNALDRVQSAGKRVFAGQIRKEDLDHVALQASFGQTKGLGFREIFYLSERPVPARAPMAGNVLDADSRGFDARFGKMTDTVDVSSLHASLQGPLNTPVLPGDSEIPRPRSHSRINKQKTTIHIDEKGFVFADADGRLFISSEALQHIGDELVIKDKISDGASRVSFFLHTDLNSIANPAMLLPNRQGNEFMRKRSPRGILGLEGTDNYRNVQLFVRGSLALTPDALKVLRPSGWTLQNVKSLDLTIAVGVRGRF